MARTKWPQDLNDEKVETRSRVKERVNDPTKIADERRREIAKRSSGGWKYCGNKARGYVWDDRECEACPDADACCLMTQKQLVNAEDRLLKILHGHGSDRWRALKKAESEDALEDELEAASIDPDILRNEVITLANQVMPEFNRNPVLAHKIRDINKKTTEVLDALVPGWKGFRQQPPRMNPEDVLDILTEIRNKTAQAIIDSCGIHEIAPHEAWEVLLGNDIYSSIRKKILKELHNELGEYCKQLEATFPVEFGRAKKEEDWPKSLGWMQKDKKIWAMMNRWEHFAPLLNLMKRKHLNHEDSQTLAEKIGKGKGLILLPRLNFESIAKELKISTGTVKKYVAALVKIGVLQMVQRPCPGQHAMYAIGYWHEFKNKKGKGFKAVYFLKDSKEMRIALAAFTPYGK